MRPVHGNSGGSDGSSQLHVHVVEPDALKERVKERESARCVSPLPPLSFRTHLMSTSSPNHVVLRVALRKSILLQPPLGDEGIRLGVDLLVVKGRPGGRDEHRSLGDDVVVRSEREVLESHVRYLVSVVGVGGEGKGKSAKEDQTRSNESEHGFDFESLYEKAQLSKDGRRRMRLTMITGGKSLKASLIIARV